MQITQTKRLSLRLFTLQDASFILQLLNIPGWQQYIGDKNVRTIEDAQTYITNGLLKGYTANGFGLWLIELKENQTSIGMCGLIRREGLQNVDIGFAMLPEYCHKGYAYEAAFATIEYAAKTLHLHHVVAITNADNIASGKLLQKLGFSFDGMIKLPGIENEVKYFSPKKGNVSFATKQ